MEDPVIVKLGQSKAFFKAGGPGELAKVPNYYKYIMDRVTVDGLWLDLCIGSANATAQHIINYSPDDIIIYGFDWFKGLPEDWVAGKNEIHAKGKFRVSDDPDKIRDFISTLEKRNPRLRVINGLIQDTLPGFLNEHDGTCAFVHFDCDLYSSTSFALSALMDRVVPGTILSFDEFYGFDNYRECEYKAFIEFIDITGYDYRFIAHVKNRRQATVKIL